VKLAPLIVFARRNVNKIEAIVIIVAVIGAAMTLAIGGSVRSDTIRITDVSNSLSPPYGELNATSVVGYDDNFSNWVVSANAQLNATQNSLVVHGVFQNTSKWTAVNLFKNVNINITSYPIFTANVDLTAAVRYGIRFYAQYTNGTEYNVWWEGSPLDHRPAIGYESIRLNMQREAFLATGHTVGAINRIELYVEDPPNSPTSFQLSVSKLSFEDDSLEQVSANQYRAIYFDVKNPPEENVSWYLNKIDSGVTVQASQGSVFLIYFFDGSVLYASTTATGLVYNKLTSYTQYTFYPDTQPQTFPELLPRSNTSIVFVATSGVLQNVAIQFANVEFLPTTANPILSQESLGLYYVFFVFFLFLLPLGIAILVFREFLSRKLVPRATIIAVLIVGMVCRIALAATTAHVFDMNVYLASIRGWFQFRTSLGSLGPTLPLTFFSYWIFYSPYALLQLAGFQDVQFLGHAAGLVEAIFVKLFPMVMDAATFFLLLRFRNNGATFVWATFYFLNPMAIFVSSVWGQYQAASMALIVGGVYWMSRKRDTRAAFAFVISGMIELIGFLPYALLLLRVAQTRLYKTLLVSILALLPVFVYPLESLVIFRLFLGLTGVTSSQLSTPGRYNLIGSFPQLSIIAQFKPLLLSEVIVLAVIILDTYTQRMTVERSVFYTTISFVFLLLFSNLLASWLWLLSIGLLYAVMKEKVDLGAFMLVLGTAVAYLEVTLTFGSTYLLLGSGGPPIQLAVEGIKNPLQIFTIMTTTLALILLFYLRYGSGHAIQTILRTSAITLSLYLLLFFWLGSYPL
jgi:hypothetical protein